MHLTLLVSGEVVEANASTRVVVIANYLFDSLPTDAFRTQDGLLYAGHVCVDVALKPGTSTRAEATKPLAWPDTRPPGWPAPDADLQRLQRQYPHKSLLQHATTTFSWHVVAVPSMLGSAALAKFDAGLPIASSAVTATVVAETHAHSVSSNNIIAACVSVSHCGAELFTATIPAVCHDV